MGGALEAVLRLKEQEKQAEQFKSQQLTEAVNIFQRAREQAQQNQLQKLQLAQQQKYQDATINNQNVDNARLEEQLGLQKRQYGKEKLKILSDARMRNKEFELKQKDYELKRAEQEQQMKLQEAAITGDYSNLINKTDNLQREIPKVNSISQRLDILGLLKEPFSNNKVTENKKLDTENINNNFESVQSPSGKWYLKKKTGIDLSNDLSPMEQIKAINLAKKIGGTRKIDTFLPVIEAELRKGTPIDTIEDNIRYSGQSDKFTGTIRSAAQSILVNAPDSRAQNTMDYIDDLVSKGDVGGAKELLKRAAIANSGVEDSRNVIGKERTINLLTEIEDDLDLLESKGINTNIFNGTIEQINGKIGDVKSPEMRAVATKISAAIQNYRRSMSGVAFSVPESKEYANMFPSISRTSAFNKANIKALKETFSGDLKNFYSRYMGKDNYNELFKDNKKEFDYSNGWTPEKESRLQELRAKKGKK